MVVLATIAGGALLFVTSPSYAGIEIVADDPRCHALAPDDDSGIICIGSDRFFDDVCRAIETYADRYALPPAYFARLIWQESRFDPLAVSPAGARGIAQFMPGTARLRGLADAFQPAAALAYSAEYLEALTRKFGNLGLAAAAYNAGEQRVSNWLSGAGGMPTETRNYVVTITGLTVEAWRDGPEEEPDYALAPDDPFHDSCVRMASARPMPRLPIGNGDWRPWGVLIAQDFSPAVAEARFARMRERYSDQLEAEEMLMLVVRNPSFGTRLRHSAMIGRDDRDAAEALCAALRRAGGSCVVVKN